MKSFLNRSLEEQLRAGNEDDDDSKLKMIHPLLDPPARGLRTGAVAKTCMAKPPIGARLPPAMRIPSRMVRWKRIELGVNTTAKSRKSLSPSNRKATVLRGRDPHDDDI